MDDNNNKPIQGLQPGSTLRMGSYRIVKVLGQGGFGLTYLAVDTALDKNVCIKEFFPKQYCGRQSDTRSVSLGTTGAAEFVSKLKIKFLKEARNIAKFNHQAIIKIHAAFEENNTAYYVMDFIEGRSLSEMVKKSGPIAPEKAVGYIRRVSEALELVHAKHVNHLDIKPANIMVRMADDSPVLIDFGLSKQYDSEGHQTSATPLGMSHGFAPMEQYNEGGVKEFSPQTDIYSLGATLFYLMSGEVPPQASVLIEEELKFPKKIPAQLVPVIRKAMSPIRRDRYQDVREFIEALDAASAPSPRKGAPKTPEPDSPTEIAIPGEKKAGPEHRPKNNTRKSNTSFWILLALIVALAIGAGVRFYLNRDTTDPVDDETMEQTDDAFPEVTTVTDMNYTTPQGQCTYTGEVDEEGLPHGSGRAEWATGEAVSYDGQWDHGHMNGQATYILRIGDRYEGTFKNDAYAEGTYTMKSNGDYYVGTFKDGQPAKGDWYSKDGVKY